MISGPSEKVETGNQEDEPLQSGNLSLIWLHLYKECRKQKKESKTQINYPEFIDVSSAQWFNLVSPNVSERNIKNMENTRIN